MDPYDKDCQMDDIQVTSSKPSIRYLDEAGKSRNGLTMSTAPTGQTRAIRSRESSRRGTPVRDNGNLSRSVRRLREPSRESSVLANNVANHLSIESSVVKPEMALGEGTDQSDGEHFPVKPYKSTLPTGLCYDVRMRYHCELDPPKQRLDYHPEDPRRIFKIYKELCMAGLVKDPLLNTGTLIPNPLVNIAAREVGEDEVCLVHDKSHFDFMKTTAGRLCEDHY